jgi:osmotically-inducible protein OsmY
MENGRDRLASFALGTTAGSLLTFLFDARSGARRRALARDRSAAFVRRLFRRSARSAKWAGATGVGWTHRARHLREQPKDYDDVTLAQKVQTEIFRSADAPKGSVDVNVANGVVQLRGEVQEQGLIDELVSQARKVQGVRDVESYLHLPGTPVH